MTHIDVCVNNEVRQAHTLFSDYGLSDRKDGRRDFVVPLEDRLEVGDLISVRLCGSDLQGSPVVLEPSLRPLERAAIRLHIEKPDMPIATRLVTVKGWLTLHGGANAIAFLVDGKPQTAFFSVRPDVCEHFDTPFAVGWEITCDVSTIVASDASEMRLTCVIDDFEIAEQRLAVAPIPAQTKPSPLLLLMHVPKTAGTSLVAAISEHTDITTHWLYHRGRSSIVDQVAALSPQAFYDLDLVGGHFFFGLHHAIDRPCRYVSVLREPLDYLRSYFAYRKVVQHFPPFRDLDLLGALELRLDHLLDNCFTRFFTALPAEQAVDDTVLARAKANMERHFAFVGLFERMDETITRFSKILGVQLKLEQINVTPSNPGGPTDRLFNEKIHPFVAYDQLLYRHAQRLFWNLMD